MNQENTLKRKRVLVGMSGGIDSSSVCMMLQEQGYEVVGVTMRVWDLPRQFSTPGQAHPDFIDQARQLAGRLGIRHYVADEREAFKRVVVDNFIGEYMQGRTPNPCVMCNPTFKFRMLMEWADRLGCDYIATGHYVKLLHDDGKHYIVCGDDERKDQSYFLWRLSQDVLSRCIFPLGEMQKVDVRDYLSHKGYQRQAKGGESMEVCFIENDYRDFLREQVPDIDERLGRGKFVDAMGRTLGEHEGYAYYTVGQRKGLGIALGEPAYVLRINPDKNTVVLGNARQLEAQAMLVTDALWVDEKEMRSPQLTVRIRYRSKPIACRVEQVTPQYGESVARGLWLVRFEATASAITPGQSAVFYIGHRMVGGAYIASQKGVAGYLAMAEESAVSAEEA